MSKQSLDDFATKLGMGILRDAERDAMAKPEFHLVDDGSLDTVWRCAECGEEERFTFTGDDLPEDFNGTDAEANKIRLTVTLDWAEEEHECAELEEGTR